MAAGGGGRGQSRRPARHLVISQSAAAAAEKNNVEAIRANCALMAPLPLSFSNWLAPSVNTHTHTDTHTHTHTRSSASHTHSSHCAGVHNGHQLHCENNIVYLGKVEAETS